MSYQFTSDFILPNQFWCVESCLVIGNNATTHFLDPENLKNYITIGMNDLIQFGVVPNIYIITESVVFHKFRYLFLKTETLFIVTPKIYQDFHQYLHQMMIDKRLYVYDNRQKSSLEEMNNNFYTNHPKKTRTDALMDYVFPLVSFLGFRKVDLVCCDYATFRTPPSNLQHILGEPSNYRYLHESRVVFKSRTKNFVDYSNSKLTIADYSLNPQLGFKRPGDNEQYTHIFDESKKNKLCVLWKNEIFSQYLTLNKNTIRRNRAYYRDLKKAGIINNAKFQFREKQLLQQEKDLYNEETYHHILRFIGIKD